MRRPNVGDVAPDFALPGVPPGTYRLSDQRGKRVVLAFYPGDFTPVCTRQLSSYQVRWDSFEETGAVLWGISVDDLERHERFAKARSLGFPLLSDAEGEVSRLFGALGLLGPASGAW
jgi:peroxiredoxin Q/BCP